MSNATIKNKAAWVDGPDKAIRVGAHDLRQPGPGELLVRNYAVAINPFDCLQQSTGEFVERWPCIFGHDLAGVVVSAGQDDGSVHNNTNRFSPGQRILAQALHQSLEDTAFQEHSIVRTDVACPIPDGLAYESACVIPLALSTAAAGLYQKGYLELPLPGAVPPPKVGKTLLVWGGSSSVGSAAIQLAIASGLDVVTTASPKNFEYCRSLGAKHVFDYNSPMVVDDIVATLQKSSHVAGAYAAVSQPSGIISTVARILAQAGGGFIATTKPPPNDLPDSVTAKMVFASDYAALEGAKFFKNFLPEALENGSYKAAPEPYIVGNGLASVQNGVELLQKGVSAKKVVVTL